MNQQPFAERKNLKQIELGTKLAPKFNNDGLIPCITVDANSKEVLMFAWMNEEALRMTLKTGKATYYSRSRQKIWVKGETSGLEQQVKQLLVDCDQDVIQLRVQVKGEGSCHRGYRSCFYRGIKDGETMELEYVINERSFDPDQKYK